MPNREGARQGALFIAVSESPDPCKTPPGNVPVPYMILAKLDDALDQATDVLFAGKPAVLASRSRVAQVTGDEAGTGGGVKSGCNRGEVQFTDGATEVFCHGQRVVRDKDPVGMNGGNTSGQVQCLLGSEPCGEIDAHGRPTVDTNPPLPALEGEAEHG